MSISGSLRTMPLAEVLTWISLHRKRGTLLVRSSRGVHKLAFDEGYLIYSAAPEGTQNLGRLLIAKGVLSEEHHEQARKVRQEGDIGLAKVLAELQICHEEEIVDMMAKKAESEIFGLLHDTDGEFEFDDAALPQLQMLPMRVDLSRAMVKIGQQIDEQGEYDFDSSGVRLAMPDV